MDTLNVILESEFQTLEIYDEPFDLEKELEELEKLLIEYSKEEQRQAETNESQREPLLFVTCLPVFPNCVLKIG